MNAKVGISNNGRLCAVSHVSGYRFNVEAGQTLKNCITLVASEGKEADSKDVVEVPVAFRKALHAIAGRVIASSRGSSELAGREKYLKVQLYAGCGSARPDCGAHSG